MAAILALCLLSNMPVPIPPRPSHTALDEGAPESVAAPLAAVTEEGAKLGEAVSQQASALFSGIAAQFSKFPSLPVVNGSITAPAENKRPLDERLHEELRTYSCRPPLHMSFWL